MSCFPCFGSGKKKEKESSSSDEESSHGPSAQKKHDNLKNNAESAAPAGGTGNIQAQNFTFRELATATKHFTPDSLMGDSGFLRVYKGVLDGGQPVAVKQLDRNSLQGKEFLVEVLMLSLLHHPNLVNLVGYCADGDQRLLVYEFMTNGSLKDHLLEMKPDKKPLGWLERMRIAFGAAQGLEYLHDKANPPVIYRDFKSSNILLDDLLTPKLSDFGLAKLGSSGDKSSLIPSGVMGTYGYSAPECSRNGQVTLKSDVYSFGVVLLELITGRKALDPDKPSSEQNLVQWAQPMFKEQKRYVELVDPKLQGDFTLKGLNQAVAVAAMCLQEESSVRPLMSDVVITLSFLIEGGPPATPEASPTPPAPQQTPPAPQPPPQRPKSSSSSSDEHVVETLQLGRSKRSPGGSKPGSRSSSRRSSRSSSRQGSGSDSSSRSSKHSKHLRASSSKHHEEKEPSKEVGSDGSSRSSSSSSKHSRSSSRYGSGRFLSLKIASGGSSKRGSPSSGSRQGSEHESDGSVSRRSESEREYESD